MTEGDDDNYIDVTKDVKVYDDDDHDDDEDDDYDTTMWK